MPSKSELRESLKETRFKLTEAKRTFKSREIVKRLKEAADWPKVKSLHFFEPIGELLEPDIIDFIDYLEDNYPGLQLCAPRKIEGEWRLVAARGGQAPDKFDAVIVPMLGFDPQTLQRVGYGGGYYDKFLATQPQARKIGVCFELGKLKKLPTEPHDIPLDLVITDTKTYKFA